MKEIWSLIRCCCWTDFYLSSIDSFHCINNKQLTFIPIVLFCQQPTICPKSSCESIVVSRRVHIWHTYVNWFFCRLPWPTIYCLLNSTRNLGEHAMTILRQSGYDLIVNPDDAPPSREWVLNHLADPQVYAACIMHSQPSDKVDKELIATANDNLRCISTFSVGYGETSQCSFSVTAVDIPCRPHRCESRQCARNQDRSHPGCPEWCWWVSFSN